jgi:hypothetical protein
MLPGCFGMAHCRLLTHPQSPGGAYGIDGTLLLPGFDRDLMEMQSFASLLSRTNPVAFD